MLVLWLTTGLDVILEILENNWGVDLHDFLITEPIVPLLTEFSVLSRTDGFLWEIEFLEVWREIQEFWGCAAGVNTLTPNSLPLFCKSEDKKNEYLSLHENVYLSLPKNVYLSLYENVYLLLHYFRLDRIKSKCVSGNGSNFFRKSRHTYFCLIFLFSGKKIMHFEMIYKSYFTGEIGCSLLSPLTSLSPLQIFKRLYFLLVDKTQSVCIHFLN